MTKTLTNADIVTIYKALNDANSFMKNNTIKLPSNMLWNLKKNMKVLSPLFELIGETEKEIYQSCLKPEYLKDPEEGQDDSQLQIKPEYMQTFISAINVKLNELSLQKNELNLNDVAADTIEKFMQDNDGKISMPELDALEYFISEE